LAARFDEVAGQAFEPGAGRGEVWLDGFIPGWVFEAKLEQTRTGGAMTGNAGLAPAAGPLPAWTGIRPLRVTSKNRESINVTSLVLEPTDGHPLTLPCPGSLSCCGCDQPPMRPLCCAVFAVGRAE
jgi:hypothetical protein